MRKTVTRVQRAFFFYDLFYFSTQSLPELWGWDSILTFVSTQMTVVKADR
jgi:hypothetical protein